MEKLNYICNMESFKVDRTKLRTVANYAIDKGVTRHRIYYLIKTGELETEKIDGVVFIKLP